MTNRFAGRCVLITGAAGALGASMTRAFAAEGASVAVAAREHHRNAAEKLAAEAGNGAFFVPLDVAKEADWAAAVATAEERAGPVAVLVNNAARIAQGGVEDIALDEWRAVIETNLTGDLLSIRAVAPSMRKRGGGSIVMISSIAALHAAPGLVAYGCSKWAIRGLVRTAAAELAKDNIRVNALHPGIIETPLAYDKAGKPLVPVDHFAMPRNASTEEMTRYALFLASDDAGFSTASELVADGGFSLGPVR